jgi:two-component system, NarL family, nitrate/nitrite response regulator NarL
MRKNRPVRIRIVGHQGIVRESLALILSSQPGVVCVPPGEPSDVILVNHDTAWDGPLEELVDAADRNGSAKHILVLTPGLDDAIAMGLVRRGVGGLCLKHNSLERLMEALHIVARGGTWLDTPYSRMTGLKTLPVDRTDQAATAGSRKSWFTQRELLALRSLIEGCSNKEIGARVGSSESAAKSLLQKLFRKTSVRSRGQLIRVALEKYRDLL